MVAPYMEKYYYFVSDEARQISQLICLALNELDFVDDYDRRLKFLTDCRAKFNRLEVVQVSTSSTFYKQL